MSGTETFSVMLPLKLRAEKNRRFVPRPRKRSNARARARATLSIALRRAVTLLSRLPRKLTRRVLIRKNCPARTVPRKHSCKRYPRDPTSRASTTSRDVVHSEWEKKNRARRSLTIFPRVIFTARPARYISSLRAAPGRRSYDPAIKRERHFDDEDERRRSRRRELWGHAACYITPINCHFRIL